MHHNILVLVRLVNASCRCEVLLEEEHLAALRLEDEHRKQQRM